LVLLAPFLDGARTVPQEVPERLAARSRETKGQQFGDVVEQCRHMISDRDLFVRDSQWYDASREKLLQIAERYRWSL
jgi:hypothetical protein